MPEEKPAGSGPFDLERLKELVELMEKHGLTEVHLQRGDERWRLRRGPQEVPLMPGAPYHLPAAGMAAPAPPGTPGPGEAKVEAEREAAVYIKSPTVGTFYSAASPGDPDFVRVGSKVEPDTIVCIVEAMKVFNQIPAEVGGTIAEVLVKNGDPVEFGQPLFKVQELSD